MKKFSFAIYFCVLIMQSSAQNIKRSYLALGDSYTIGEAVSSEQNFPHQVVNLLNKAGLYFQPPLIIAKTGWTTDELDAGIAAAKPAGPYDLVTLLIGVNNQYRGRSIDEYKSQFEALLLKAIEFAGGNNGHVYVLSIPDWSVTPFAADRDTRKIAEEIDVFNAANSAIAQQHKVNYIEITEGSRDARKDQQLVAGDGLHPSGKEYAKWAENLAADVVKNHK